MAEVGIVYVVDDDPPMLELIAVSLKHAGLRVETFGSTEALLAAKTCISTAARKPEGGCCLLLDLEMPGKSGLEFLKQLRAEAAPASVSRALCPIIMVTAKGSVRSAVASMKLGAVDFLEKPFETEALVALVQETLARHRQELAAVRQDSAVRGRIADLSPRERELLHAIVQGQSTKMIADSLGISPRTVDHHRANVMEKMKADNVADLVRMAMEADYRSVGGG